MADEALRATVGSWVKYLLDTRDVSMMMRVSKGLKLALKTCEIQVSLPNLKRGKPISIEAVHVTFPKVTKIVSKHLKKPQKPCEWIEELRILRYQLIPQHLPTSFPNLKSLSGSMCVNSTSILVLPHLIYLELCTLKSPVEIPLLDYFPLLKSLIIRNLESPLNIRRDYFSELSLKGSGENVHIVLKTAGEVNWTLKEGVFETDTVDKLTLYSGNRIRVRRVERFYNRKHVFPLEIKEVENYFGYVEPPPEVVVKNYFVTLVGPELILNNTHLERVIFQSRSFGGFVVHSAVPVVVILCDTLPPKIDPNYRIEFTGVTKVVFTRRHKKGVLKWFCRHLLDQGVSVALLEEPDDDREWLKKIWPE